MAKIHKMLLHNFKKFTDLEIKFNDKYNIFIGDNEAGKSTILQALDFVLSGSQRKIENYDIENLFNKDTIENFINGDRDIRNLPTMCVEVYLSEQNNPNLNGENNHDKRCCDGIKFECYPDDDFLKEISDVLQSSEHIFPFDYYTTKFQTFAHVVYNNYRRYLNHIYIDSSNINTEGAIKDYIKTLYQTNTDHKTKSIHKHNFRHYKINFATDILKSFNETLSDYNFGLSNSTRNNLENNLTIIDDKVNLENKGKGKLCYIKTEFALKKQVDNIDIILLEEPENHLSHVNMRKLINNISASDDKQLFISTHSNMICSRLGLENLILLNSNSAEHMILSDLEEDSATKDTPNFFMKAPNNNLLNFILSQKVILVEGASEYILLEKFFSMITNKNIDDCNVHIIEGGGITFKHYLNIAKKIKSKVVVITDNDSSYEENIKEKYANYYSDEINVFADKNNENHTLEVAIFNSNSIFFKDFEIAKRNSDTLNYMLNNKTEAAFRLLQQLEETNSETFIVPEYIKEAIEWINK